MAAGWLKGWLLLSTLPMTQADFVRLRDESGSNQGLSNVMIRGGSWPGRVVGQCLLFDPDPHAPHARHRFAVDRQNHGGPVCLNPDL